MFNDWSLIFIVIILSYIRGKIWIEGCGLNL
jgi:hypothetical protein